jgi:hypothetical protein
MLTIDLIERARPWKGRIRKIWEEREYHGLYLHVEPSGTKLFRWFYYLRGRARGMTLGEFPKMSLTWARACASECQTLLDEGKSPFAYTIPHLHTIWRLIDRPAPAPRTEPQPPRPEREVIDFPSIETPPTRH